MDTQSKEFKDLIKAMNFNQKTEYEKHVEN